VTERVLTLEDLERADGLFITSTTRDVLPVEAIEGLSIRKDWTVARRLAQAFAEYQAQYAAQAARRAARGV